MGRSTDQEMIAIEKTVYYSQSPYERAHRAVEVGPCGRAPGLAHGTERKRKLWERAFVVASLVRNR